MLLELYQINEDGEDVQVKPEDLKITHKTLVIVVSHDTRYVYIFKGSKVSIVQKFASARKASALRLQKGYRIKHVEETEGIDEDFLPILDYLGGIVENETDKVPVKNEPKKTTLTQQKEKPKVSPALQKKTPELKKKDNVKKSTVKMKGTTKTQKITKGLPAPEDMPPKLAKIYTAMTALESPKNSCCDYVLVGNKLYLLVGENKNDLSQGKFSFEEVSTLPEGVFPVENYYPRILVSKKKILGVELWARR